MSIYFIPFKRNRRLQMSQKRIGLTEGNKEGELLWESREARV